MYRSPSHLSELRAARSAAESQADTDTDTVDLFTSVITEVDKNAWFLRASIEP